MKRTTLASMLALTAAALAMPSLAQTSSRGRPVEQGAYIPSAPVDSERGTVISVTPMVQQVAVPRRECFDEQVAVQRQPSGAGALIGAIAGGAIGNAVGAGAGRAAATALGVVGGAAVGNNIEAGGQGAQVQTVRRCAMRTSYEDRTSGYNVVYEYAGRQYTTQMRQDPGRYVQIHVQAAAEGELPAPAYPAPARVRSAAPVYVERPVVQAYPEPVYPAYAYPAPVVYESGYPQFGVGLAVGALIGYGIYHGGHRYYGHGWRGR